MPYEKSPSRPDVIILFITVTLVMIGLIMVYSAKLYVDQSYLQKQALRIAIGLVALGIGYAVPLGFWRGWPSVIGLMIVITVALLLTLKFGTLIRGARRQLWGIQFSELAKPAIVLFLAAYYATMDRLSDARMEFRKFALYPVLACAPAVALVFWEPAVSMALVITLLIATMLYLAEVKARQILLVGAMSVVLGGVALGGKSLVENLKPTAPSAESAASGSSLTSPQTLGGERFKHIRERCSTYVVWATHILDFRSELDTVRTAEGHPGHSKLDYQQEQSRIAVGSGSLFGLGLGNGKQKFAFLPMVATDFIFSLIGEEWGFVGSFTIFILFLLFLLRGLFLIRRAEDTFTRLVMSGVVFMIVGTALIHLSVALRLIPPTGQTLPFVSYGASAMAANMFGVGLLLQASKHILRRPIENDLVSRGWNWWARVSGSGAR